MHSRVGLVFAAFLILVIGSIHPLYAQDTAAPEKTASNDASAEPAYFTVSGGWSWPVGGPVQDTYQSGFGFAASFRTGLASDYLGGFEVGYSWYSLDSAKLAEQTPGSTFSGGDMGLLSITTENDYLFGTPGNSMRPFLNLGLGYYKSFIDETTKTTGSTAESYWTGVYDGSFFGFHAGVGTLINKERFGVRLDANYQHLFAGGPDLEFFSARGGIIFYLDS